jgi:L-lactate utilization protein LutB
MKDFNKIRYDKSGPVICKALEKRGFLAKYASTSKEALELAHSLIPADDVVSFGGAMSAEQIGLIEKVKETNKILDRDSAKSPEERNDAMRRALLCDTYIMGCNAISADGTLVNIDGNGNRVAALAFGPKSILMIVGMNKICPDLATARARARNIAAPTNSQRFDIKTPCKADGLCHDCLSPDCICNMIIETRHSRVPERIKIILVGEDLGM